MIKAFVLFILFCVIVGIDAEFASYAVGGGLLNGSIVSIVLFTGVIIFTNYLLILGMYKVIKNKEIFK